MAAHGYAYTPTCYSVCAAAYVSLTVVYKCDTQILKETHARINVG